MEIPYIIWKNIKVIHPSKTEEIKRATLSTNQTGCLHITEYNGPYRIVLGKPQLISLSCYDIEFDAIWFNTDSTYKVKVRAEF